MLAPYDQCLSSRRFMLSRAPKFPPGPSFIASIAISFGLFSGGAITPATITDCRAPGLSTRYTVLLAGKLTVLTVFFGTAPGLQPENSFSSFGVTSAIVVSPTITRVALFGLNHALWNLTRSSRVSFETLAVVPNPVSGLPYAWSL